MITIIECKERKNQKGETFVALILSGGVELVRSRTSNKHYATTRQASVPSTLSLTLAKTMIGQKMPGSIAKVPCDPYEYKTLSGDEIILDFTYEYQEETNNMAETVFEG